MNPPDTHPLVTAYLAAVAERGHAPATVRATRSDLAQFALWWVQQTPLPFDPMLVREQDIRRWQHARQAAGAKPTTLNRALISLRGWFTWLVDQGARHDHPAQGVAPVKETPLSPRALPPLAIDALFRALDRDPNRGVRLRNEALVVLLVYAGLREQEACAVQLRDVDLAAGMLVVRAGKRGASRRIPLHREAQRALQRYLDTIRCPDRLPTVGSPAEREPLLGRFTRKGQADSFQPGLTAKAVYKLVRGLGQRGAALLRDVAAREPVPPQAEQFIAAAAQLEQVSPHRLRHSLARRLLTAGAPLPEVQRILGHSRLTTTGMYLTPNEDDGPMCTLPRIIKTCHTGVVSSEIALQPRLRF